MTYSNEVSRTNKYLFAFIAFLIVPLSGISIDIYVPSLPAVSAYFATDKSMAQLTVTFYIVGLGLMQLVTGSISDSFGRRKPFLIAMFIYIVTSLGIALSHHIYQLLLLRLIQGTAVATIVVSMRSVIPDLFTGREVYKMMNYMTVAWSIGPIIAPAMGGYLQYYFGWQSNFYFLAGYGALSFSLVLLFLPETSVDRHPFHAVAILKRYKEILLHGDYASALITNGLLYSILILFSVTGAFLMQNVLHYSSIQFGHAALFAGLAWLLGALTNRFLINIELVIKTKICLWIMLLLALTMASCALLLPITIYNIMVPLFLLIWAGGILFPNYFARAVSLFPKTTGSANALFGAFVFLISGISSGFAIFLNSSTQLPLAMTYAGLIIICLVICYGRSYSTN